MQRIGCESVVVQIICTQYNEEGKPIGESVLPGLKVFRANPSGKDFWAHVDKVVAAAIQRAAAEGGFEALPSTESRQVGSPPPDSNTDGQSTT